MSRERQPNQIILATVSAIPLFYGASGMREAVFLAGSVLSSLLVFEALFFLVKRFWLRSLRLLLALVVLACLLSGILFIGKLFLIGPMADITTIFPLTLVSAFLLAHNTISISVPLKIRFWTWGQFLILLLIVGTIRQWNGAFQTFPPAPFWISGAVLAIFLFLERRTHS